MDIQHIFTAQLVDHSGSGTLTDGGVLWQVVTPDGERIASCTSAQAARELETSLNLVLTDWADADPSDRTVDA